MSIKGKAYIMGAYEHPLRDAPDKSTPQIHAECAKGALEDAGLTFAPYPLQREVMQPILEAAARGGRDDLDCLPAGQSAMLAREESVAEVLARLTTYLCA